MSDEHSYSAAEWIRDYDFAESSIWFVSVECLIIAFIVGVSKLSFVYGIATFFALMILYAIPVVGGIISVAMSMVEAIIVGSILSHFISESAGCIISVFTFFLFILMHRHFSVISDDRVFGYSFIISECILNSLLLWYASSSIPLACVVFAALIAFMFVPILRVVELIALTIWTAIEVYIVICTSLTNVEKKYVIIATVLVFIYVAYNHVAAYSMIDYKGMKHEKQMAKERAEALVEFEQLKEKLYSQYPELGKQYHYYKVSVCENDKERTEFEFDWKLYLYHLENISQLITFNQFFDEKGLYKSRTYNKDFANEWKQQQGHNQDIFENKEPDNIIYFTGITDMDALKKRYRDLLKIYHPDNQNGDTSTVQKIQEEYEFLKAQYEEKAAN